MDPSFNPDRCDPGINITGVHSMGGTGFNPLSSSYSLESSEPLAKYFRFVDLPAEIRNKIYRLLLIRRKQPVPPGKFGPRDLAILSANRFIYSEATPVFLSGNHFLIKGTRVEYKWLRNMRTEGRNELRNITLQIQPSWRKHDYSLYNALSLCENVHLVLSTGLSRLAMVSREGDGNLRNMHGFSTVTAALPNTTDLCEGHQEHAPSEWELERTQEVMQAVEHLLQQFQAPCTGKCRVRVHKGREGPHTQASLHVSFQPKCYYCP